MKKVVPEGILTPLYSISLMLFLGKQMGMTVQNRRVSLTNAVT